LVQEVRSVSKPVLVSDSVVERVNCPGVEVLILLPLCPVQSVSLQGDVAAKAREGGYESRRMERIKKTARLFLHHTKNFLFIHIIVEKTSSKHKYLQGESLKVRKLSNYFLLKPLICLILFQALFWQYPRFSLREKHLFSTLELLLNFLDGEFRWWTAPLA